MKKRETVCKAAQLRQGAAQPFGQMAQCVDLGAETELYRRVRSAVPVLDAAIVKDRA